MWPPGLSRLSPRQLDGVPGSPFGERRLFRRGAPFSFVYVPVTHTGTWPNFPASAEVAGVRRPPVKGGVVHYEEDRRALDDLTNLFFHTIKPSELFRLTMTINAMCNLGDFIHSIRLMSAARTTVPTRIEADSAD